MKKLPVVCAMALFVSSSPASADQLSDTLAKINLPPGFTISVFASSPSPRSMDVDKQDGRIYVGNRGRDLVAIQDADGDGVADDVDVLFDRLNVPNGIAIKEGTLFVALQDRLVKLSLHEVPERQPTTGDLVSVAGGFHNSGHHGWRYADFGPDGKLYISLGAPCNICELTGNTGKIIRLSADGTDVEVVADGVRNSVGFDWHPVTRELWFTDNGADNMGEDIPADELNRVTRMGQHFGFPFRGGKSTPLTGYESTVLPVDLEPAAIEFQAHSANLGIDFYEGDMFPAEYKNDAFVAQHGSWNREEPVGYRIMRVKFDEEGNAVGKEVFADGWLDDGDILGRPVDIEELSDGSLLVSDDFSNVIYRITYDG